MKNFFTFSYHVKSSKLDIPWRDVVPWWNISTKNPLAGVLHFWQSLITVCWTCWMLQCIFMSLQIIMSIESFVTYNTLEDHLYKFRNISFTNWTYKCNFIAMNSLAMTNKIVWCTEGLSANITLKGGHLENLVENLLSGTYITSILFNE